MGKLLKALKRKVKHDDLRKLNLWLGVLLVMQAAVILSLSNHYSQPIVAHYLTRDELASQNGPTVFAEAVKHVADVRIANVVAGFLFITALHLLWQSTLGRKMYQTRLRQTVNPGRWIVLAITSSLMVGVIALLSGVQDKATLLLMGTLLLIMSVVNLSMEHQNRANQPITLLNYGVSIISAALPWVVIGFYALDAAWFGPNHLPYYLYFVYASTLLGFIGLGVNQLRWLNKQGKFADYPFAERNYVMLLFVIESALAWQIFAGPLR